MSNTNNSLGDAPYKLIKSNNNSILSFLNERLILDKDVYQSLRKQAHSIEFCHMSCLMGPEEEKRITKDLIGDTAFLNLLDSFKEIIPSHSTSYYYFSVSDIHGKVLLSHSCHCLPVALKEWQIFKE